MNGTLTRLDSGNTPPPTDADRLVRNVKIMSLAVPAVVLSAGILTSAFTVHALVLAAASVLGWTQLVGLRGQALVGALTPLVKVAGSRITWLANAAAYSLAGPMASGCVGALLAWLGLLLPGLITQNGSLVLGVVVLACWYSRGKCVGSAFHSCRHPAKPKPDGPGAFPGQ